MTDTLPPPSKKQRTEEAAPEAFQTLESLGQWPTEILARFFCSEQADADDASQQHAREAFLRRRRVEALVQQGLVLHTDFSGKGSVETVLRIMDKAGKDTGAQGSSCLCLQFPCRLFARFSQQVPNMLSCC